MRQNALQKLEAFFLRHPYKTYKKRQIIIGGVKEETGVMYITGGYVRQYILSSEGQEHTTGIFGPSDMFPLAWVARKENSYRYFEAVTDIFVRVCPRETFTQFLSHDAHVCWKVLEQLLIRFDQLQRMTYISLSGNAQTKIVVLLLLLCQRFGEKDRTRFLPFPLTHKDIANFLGLTRETVSIAMKKLLDEESIIRRGHYWGIDAKQCVYIEKYQLQNLLD